MDWVIFGVTWGVPFGIIIPLILYGYFHKKDKLENKKKDLW